MDEFRFDDFIRRRFLKDPGQVSRALNLVLRLEHPWKMPQLLLQISKRQREVDEALNELNFVHFARFLPTHNGSALQVITEFDGPLEPYAMDFAIAIGEVFTVILGFVADRPPLPVKDHPDEFWAFIKRNNRVRILGLPLPEESYYPVYSAYPRETVLDIVGPRKQLPLPVADRPSADIDLADVQGNLLDSYRARFARHFILAVTDARRARSWLAGLAKGPQDGVPQITTAECRPETPTAMLNVGFTHAGLEALGVKPKLLERFPQAFREGPANEARAKANGDVGPSAPGHWIFGAPGRAEHAMLSIHACKDGEHHLEAASRAVRNALGAEGHPCGLRVLSEHAASALPDQREHFGFRDGIAQPRIAHRHGGPRDMQPAVSPGEFLLGAHYKDIFGGPSIGRLAPQLATNGTFCAVRVLAQHVDAFNKMLDDGVSRLGVSRDLLAAKLVGRWFDGQPLSSYPTAATRATAPAQATMSNEFDYAPSYEYPDTFDDHAGMRCPIGAHIRRVNPRTSRVAGVRYSRRLIRRGMTYSWAAVGPRPAEKGIFGLFYCGSLERQFEFIQQHWVDGDVFTSGIRGTQDPIGGSQTLSGTFVLPGMGPGGTAATLKVPRLTTTRGSLYLFVPGIKALQALERSGLVAAPLMLRNDVKAMRSMVVAGSAGRILRRLEERFFASEAPASAPKASPTAPASASVSLRFDPDRFDPTDRGFLANPYPTFARFRRFRPVHYVPKHDAFWVFSHDLVAQLCTDSVRFLKLPPASRAPRGLFTMDPPRHTEVRQLLELAFRAATADAQHVAEQVTEEALGAIPAGRFDLVECFARRVPREVFFRMLGVPLARQAEIDRLARRMLMLADRTLDSVQHLIWRKAGISLGFALLRMLPGALLGPKGTLLHAIARQTWPLPGARLTTGESVVTLLHFVLGGYMSTEFLLCTGTRNLLLDGRRQWQVLQANPGLWSGALEEMRRFDTPLGVIDRYAAADMTLGKVKIPCGSRLMGMLGSANHDTAVFGGSAETFDITRRKLPNVALGRGIHECIGRPLQEIVAPLALCMLMHRFPNLSLASSAQPPWLTDPYFRSFSRLTVCP